MNYRILGAFALLVGLWFHPAHAETEILPGTDIIFEVPEGFGPLSQEIMDFKWPSNRAPQYAIGNETGGTTIAYDLKPQPQEITQASLPELQKTFVIVFERMIPNIEWKKNEIISLAGQNWILLEATSSAVDTDIYNIMLVTDYDGEMVGFNFNSTKEEFPQYEAALRKSIESIKFQGEENEE